MFSRIHLALMALCAAFVIVAAIFGVHLDSQAKGTQPKAETEVETDSISVSKAISSLNGCCTIIEVNGQEVEQIPFSNDGDMPRPNCGDNQKDKNGIADVNHDDEENPEDQ